MARQPAPGDTSYGEPLPPLSAPRRLERSDARLAFALFALAGLASPFLAEWVVDDRLGYDTEGTADEIAMASLVALVLFGVLAVGLGVRSWPLLLGGIVVADVCAFVGFLVLFWSSAA